MNLFNDNDDRELAKKIISKEFSNITEFIDNYHTVFEVINDPNRIKLVDGKYWMDLCAKTSDGTYYLIEMEKMPSYNKLWNNYNKEETTILVSKYWKYFHDVSFEIKKFLLYLETDGDFNNLTGKYCLIDGKIIHDLIQNENPPPEIFNSKHLKKDVYVYPMKKHCTFVFGDIHDNSNSPFIITISKNILEKQKSLNAEIWNYSIGQDILKNYNKFQFKIYDENRNDVNEYSKIFTKSEILNLIDFNKSKKYNFFIIPCKKIKKNFL